MTSSRRFKVAFCHVTVLIPTTVRSLYIEEVASTFKEVLRSVVTSYPPITLATHEGFPQAHDLPLWIKYIQPEDIVRQTHMNAINILSYFSRERLNKFKNVRIRVGVRLFQ